MRPLVSIVVPMYKCEPYLKKCLDSLINQTLREIEIVCVNDGSPDNSAKIVQEYQKNDNRIVLINQKNKGLAQTRNVGIKKVHAPYVMFCDSDDFYDLDMCEKMYHAINDNDVDIACCGTKVIYEAGEKIKKGEDRYLAIKFNGKKSISHEILLGTDVSSWNKIFKMDKIKKYHLSFPKGLIYEDAAFFFGYTVLSKNIYYLSEKLHNYLRHSGSIMSASYKKNDRVIDNLKIRIAVYHFLKKKHLFLKWKKTFLYFFLGGINFCKDNLPENQRHRIYEIAWPIMKKFSAQDIALLRFWPQEQWRQILRLCYNQRFISTKKLKD
jgi:glycosyltransferase involved in cell wall biosynthesis